MVGVIVFAFCVAFYQMARFENLKRIGGDWVELHTGLYQFYSTQTNYPAYSLDELHKKGVVHEASLEFIRTHNVQFKPFSSSDSDETVVLVLTLAPDKKVRLRKKDIMRSPWGPSNL